MAGIDQTVGTEKRRVQFSLERTQCHEEREMFGEEYGLLRLRMEQKQFRSELTWDVKQVRAKGLNSN